MEEYTGRFFGGPDDGNVVTATQTKIAAITTTEMWLDGETDDKTTTIITSKGTYIWDPDEKLFIWHHESTNVFSKKVEAA